MLQRSSSKNLRAAPGPTFMSNRQMGEYLHDLRTNRVARPNGSRPLPQSKRQSLTLRAARPHSPTRPSVSSNESDLDQSFPSTGRSSSRLSYRQSLDATVSKRVSSQELDRLAQEENDRRQMEKLEARAVRRALEEADQQEEERIFTAAQQEAEELIWKHQNHDSPYNLEKDITYDANDINEQETAWYADGERGNEEQNNGTSYHTTTPEFGDGGVVRTVREEFDVGGALNPKKQRSASKLAHFSITSLANRRKSSGSNRTPSGGRRAGFPNSSEKIYEDPVDRTNMQNSSKDAEKSQAAVVRRNPFARAHAARQSVSRLNGRSIHGVEIQNNEPSQSRDPTYTSNHVQPQASFHDDEPNIKYRNGIEVRNDELRAATSMRMKDRSPKLPSPTAVTNSPGRPIVSFKPDWKPPADSAQVNDIESKNGLQSSADKGLPAPVAPEPIKSASAPIVPTIGRPAAVKTPSGEAAHIDSGAKSEKGRSPMPTIPSINVPVSAAQASETTAESTSGSVPSIVTPGIPAIAIDLAPDETQKTPTMGRTEPQKHGGPPPIPVINEPRPSPKKSATAPASFFPPRANPALRGATALCAQCALPISGKIVTAAGTRFHPQCFTCYHCGEGLECVAFYPEPADRREKRLDRHERRLNEETVEEEGQDSNPDEDGDDSLRFYCHLDFHELFSPRCKSCKTPIEGEVIVACGAEWHVGHFFCAQCGDPFDPSTPFVEKEGYAWCVNCHTNRYSAKCRKCRKPVTGMVLKALGTEWHDDCFICEECNGKFTDGKYFLRGDSQAPVCSACEERRLKM